VSKVKAAAIRKQAIIMIGEVFGPRDMKELKKSKLYDESFEHGFRTAR
jgi:precorrin-4 methylase